MLYLPDYYFMLYAWLIGGVAVAIGAKNLTDHVRVSGAASWILLLGVSGIPAAMGPSMAALVLLDAGAALPPAALAVVTGVLWIHIFLPALLPDFQVRTWMTSCLLAMLLGASVYAAGAITKEFPNGWLIGMDGPGLTEREGRAPPELDLGI